MKEELEVYRNGVCCCSICTNIKDRKKIEQLVNLKNPTGISSKWEISEDKTFKGGESNPCPCERKPEPYKHYLMNC